MLKSEGVSAKRITDVNVKKEAFFSKNWLGVLQLGFFFISKAHKGNSELCAERDSGPPHVAHSLGSFVSLQTLLMLVLCLCLIFAEQQNS